MLPAWSNGSANPAISDRRTSDQDRPRAGDRLTKAGRAEFRKMAAEHEIWIADMFSILRKGCRDLMRLWQDQIVGAEAAENKPV